MDGTIGVEGTGSSPVNMVFSNISTGAPYIASGGIVRVIVRKIGTGGSGAMSDPPTILDQNFAISSNAITVTMTLADGEAATLTLRSPLTSPWPNEHSSFSLLTDWGFDSTTLPSGWGSREVPLPLTTDTAAPQYLEQPLSRTIVAPLDSPAVLPDLPPIPWTPG